MSSTASNETAFAAAGLKAEACTKAIYVTGMAAWAPGYGSLEAYMSQAPSESATMPACAVIDSRSKRGTSRIARMLVEVVARATFDAGLDVSDVPTVYASAWGEIETMLKLLGQIFDADQDPSPLRFKHSVHNAAGGILSVASRNTAFSTAVAAGYSSVQAGLMEAWSRLADPRGTDEHMVVAFGDDALSAPLNACSDHEGLALAFCLSKATTEAPPAGAYARVDTFQWGPNEPGEVDLRSAPIPAGMDEARFWANPTAAAQPLAHALWAMKQGALDGPQTISLRPSLAAPRHADGTLGAPEPGPRAHLTLSPLPRID